MCEKASVKCFWKTHLVFWGVFLSMFWPHVWPDSENIKPAGVWHHRSVFRKKITIHLLNIFSSFRQSISQKISSQEEPETLGRLRRVTADKRHFNKNFIHPWRKRRRRAESSTVSTLCPLLRNFNQCQAQRWLAQLKNCWTHTHTHTLQPLLFNDYFFWRCHREMWGGSSSNRHVGRLFSLKVDGFSSKIRFFLSLGSTTADIIIVRQYWLCCLPRTLTQGWNDQDHFCLIRLFFQVTGSVETLVSCSPALMCGGATVTDAVLLFLTFLYIFSVRWFCLHIIFGFVGIL